MMKAEIPSGRAHSFPSAALQILSDPTSVSSVTLQFSTEGMHSLEQGCSNPKSRGGYSLILEIKYYDSVGLQY